jgi:NADP-dependent 3-hydroxy acid dehydrogenase YdfG
MKAQFMVSMDKFATPLDAIARAIAFAIERPANVDVSEIIVRPTAQG